MEAIGRIKTVSPKGHIILVSSRSVKIGDFLCDEQSRPIGRILRIFGPVTRPYAAVLPVQSIRGELHRLMGKAVYLESRGKRHGKEKRHNGRRGRSLS